MIYKFLFTTIILLLAIINQNINANDYEAYRVDEDVYNINHKVTDDINFEAYARVLVGERFPQTVTNDTLVYVNFFLPSELLASSWAYMINTGATGNEATLLLGPVTVCTKCSND